MIGRVTVEMFTRGKVEVVSHYDIDHVLADRMRREKEELRSRMAERGYGLMNNGTYRRPKYLFVHQACGVVVADPDTHDKYCPAKAAPGFFED